MDDLKTLIARDWTLRDAIDFMNRLTWQRLQLQAGVPMDQAGFLSGPLQHNPKREEHEDHRQN